ncbi:MAG: hypothetical protein D3910_11775, partial [Candidatus Electrothrix sp. ATG2]|nr:hypothetical protein [Candidatus Electrothrix sp. ATG2]
MNLQRVGLYLLPITVCAGIVLLLLSRQNKEPQHVAGNDMVRQRLVEKNAIGKTARSFTSGKTVGLSEQTTGKEKQLEAPVTEKGTQGKGQQEVVQRTPYPLTEKLKALLSHEITVREQGRLSEELVNHLRKNSEPSLPEEIVKLVTEGNLSHDEQGELLRFLGKLGTYDAVQALTSLIPLLDDESSKEQLAEVFADLGASRWDTAMFAKNPHPLEAAWQYAAGDELLEPALAEAIVGIGTPNGIALLLKSLDENSGSSAEQQRIVGNALIQIKNSESMQILGKTLRNNDTDYPAGYFAGYALAHNATEQAIENLLDWASNASSSESGLVDEWLRTTIKNNANAVHVITRKTVHKKFDDPEVEESIHSLISEY